MARSSDGAVPTASTRYPASCRYRVSTSATFGSSSTTRIRSGSGCIGSAYARALGPDVSARPPVRVFRFP